MLVFTSLFGQVDHQTQLSEFNEHADHQCAHTEIHERLMEENPLYRAEQEEQLQSIEALVQQYKSGMVPKNGTIHTIPVVVHIIHDGDAYGTGSNITDEQVYSAINALNQDYRKMAGTLGDGDGADIEVEFCLAQRDPDGNASTGINRVSGCSVTDYCTEGITAGNGQGASEVDIKNLSRWPNQQYYNIWVVTEIENNNGGSGIQGYAYFPTTSMVDGTVLLYNAFGTEGALKSYTNRNKTLTHEMGHAFALFHTFQGGNCSESNCTLQGDRVCDTPPTTLNSNCNNPACGGTQQVENYMDYTSQTCKNMFTEGQKLRMRAAIENSRSNLINSNGCEPVTTILADAAITGITSPTGNLCSNLIQPIVTLTNEGSSNLNNAIIEYRTGGSWETYNWTGLLGQDQSTEIQLPNYNGGWGIQTIEVRSTLPNGNNDSNNSNNSFSAEYNAVQNGHTLTLNIVKDILGGQTTWLFRNSDNEVIASGGPYTNFQSGTVETEIVCVDNGCYDFVIMDIAGDGICCGNGNGSYTLTDEDGNILASGGDFGTQETTNFCFDNGGDAPVANFSAASTTICEGGSTTFTNLTTGDVDSYEWKFFGGSPFTVTTANPGTITYDTPGTYNVRLVATNAFGNDVELKSEYITVSELQTWYADTDNDGHGNPSSTTESCTQPGGYVATGDDCNDSNGSDWDSCYDCLGVMNGSAQLDNCGTCDSNTSNDCTQDCAGVWGGNAYEDNCGTCDANTSNDCVQDCAGVWGGNAYEDNCGTCDANTSNDCVQDCAGVWGGNAYEDNCGTCDANSSNDCVQDCAGVWGGNAYEDNCGTCDANTSNDCVQDCAGNWGGTAYFDECGTCDDIPENDCVLCEGVSISLLATTSPLCFGDSTGEIAVEIATNTNDYSLSWNNGMNGTILTALNAGTYQATLTEGDCNAFIEVVLEQPEELTVSISNILNDDCADEETGSASFEISGGVAPYAVTINNEIINENSLNGLAAGEFTVAVSDANGCAASTILVIEQMSCDTLDQTEVIAALCDSGFVRIQDAVQAIPVQDATSYMWELRDLEDLNNPITFTTTDPEFYGNEIDEITPNVTYEVKVKGVNPLIPSEYGSECTLLFMIPITNLIQNDCGNLALPANHILTALEVEGAMDYEFRFENKETLDRLYYYSGGENTCALTDVDGLELDTEYSVLIRAKYGNIWGDYGNNCTIKSVAIVVTTSLTDEWCENYSINFESDLILVQPIENATVYQLRIQNETENFELILENNQPEFLATSVEGLEPETNYEAQARAFNEGFWTPWGAVCGIALEGQQNLKLNMFVFPNPSPQGKHVKLLTRGDWKNVVITLSDLQGHKLISFRKDFKDMTPQEMNISRLESGLYILHITHGLQTLSKKLLVQ